MRSRLLFLSLLGPASAFFAFPYTLLARDPTLAQEAPATKIATKIAQAVDELAKDQIAQAVGELTKDQRTKEYCEPLERVQAEIMGSCASAIYRLLDAEQHALSNRGEEGGHAGRRRPAWPVARVCGAGAQRGTRLARGYTEEPRGCRNARGAFPECENAGKRVFRSGIHGRPPTLPGYTDAPPSRGDTRKPDRGYTETL